MKLSPIDTDDHLMTIDDYVDCVNDGSFIDYDGYGRYATTEGMSNEDKHMAYPSETNEKKVKAMRAKGFTHVVWFNR